MPDIAGMQAFHCTAGPSASNLGLLHADAYDKTSTAWVEQVCMQGGSPYQRSHVLASLPAGSLVQQPLLPKP